MSNDNTILKAPVEVPKTAEEQLTDKYEDSAFFIHQSRENFRKLVYKLADRKKRAVVRVLEAVLFEPLESIELTGKEENELFDICQAVMYHKGIVLEYAMKRFELKKQGEVKDGETK